MRRLLQVDQFPGKDRITEYRLTLRDLHCRHLQSLAERGWTITGSEATVSLPVDAYERERDWLTEHHVI